MREVKALNREAAKAECYAKRSWPNLASLRLSG
jgi:hypothetical protein